MTLAEEVILLCEAACAICGAKAQFVVNSRGERVEAGPRFPNHTYVCSDACAQRLARQRQEYLDKNLKLTYVRA